MKNTDIYKDISSRTNGDIYIGVVGPVRTGKSTFIKNFMEKFVIPNIDDEYKKDRANDELPQSAAGRTIMTTEPKFVPNESVEINLDNKVSLKTRLVDCVGYLVDSAVGHMEDDMPRMVKTPWSDEQIPFAKAAEIGTKKVIQEHSTIGLVITTDGSITDIPREDYIDAETRVISELKEINKPFVVILNSIHPDAQDTIKLAEQLGEMHNISVLPMDIAELNESDLTCVFERVLDEFPVTQIGFKLPEWFSILEFEHWLKQDVIGIVKNSFNEDYSLREVSDLIKKISNESEIFESLDIDNAQMEDGSIKIKMNINQNMFYKVLSEISNFDIASDGDIFALLKNFSKTKVEYDKIAMALEEVRVKGYGIVTPQMDELTLEEPEIVKQGNKYGVKLKASAPSIHTECIKQKCNISKKEKQHTNKHYLQCRALHIHIRKVITSQNKLRDNHFRLNLFKI
ncbi:MAG: stage IV sporulation protein A [Clostridia bacterium]